jgi:hypothetical protein
MPTANGFPKHKYGFQVIMGFGSGINLAVVVMAAPLAFSAQDLGMYILAGTLKL